MKRSFSVVMGLFVVAFAFAGCAKMPYLGGVAGWVTLIDGEKGLENWNQVGDANWRAEDGAIVADKGKGGYLVSKNSYKDFQLRIEFWAAHDANSGIYMRCQDGNKPTDRTCYEANIYDQRPDQTHATGGIVHIGPVLSAQKAGGKWNTFDITVKGSQLTVVLNGVRTAEATDTKLASGPFGLQFGNRAKGAPGGAIKFRKVQIRPL